MNGGAQFPRKGFGALAIAVPAEAHLLLDTLAQHHLGDPSRQRVVAVARLQPRAVGAIARQMDQALRAVVGQAQALAVGADTLDQVAQRIEAIAVAGDPLHAVASPARRAFAGLARARLGATETGAVQFVLGKCLASVLARMLADALQAVAGGVIAVGAGRRASAPAGQQATAEVVFVAHRRILVVVDADQLSKSVVAIAALPVETAGQTQAATLQASQRRVLALLGEQRVILPVAAGVATHLAVQGIALEGQLDRTDQRAVQMTRAIGQPGDRRRVAVAAGLAHA